MNLLKIPKMLGKGVLQIADAGAKVNAPVLSQIDRIADAVTEIKSGSNQITTQNIDEIIADLAKAKSLLRSPKSALESNRFKMALLGLIAALLAHLGLPPDMATQASEVVVYIVGAYVLGDTLRPSSKPEV